MGYMTWYETPEYFKGSSSENHINDTKLGSWQEGGGQERNRIKETMVGKKVEMQVRIYYLKESLQTSCLN